MTQPVFAPKLLYGFVDIRGFGAACDGTTDDSGAINNALATALASKVGTVWIPAGVTCRTASPLVVPAGVRLSGAGMGATTLSVAAGVEAIQITDATNASISDLAITSAGGAHVVHAKAATTNVFHPTVERVWIKPGFGSAGTSIQSRSGNTLNSTNHGLSNGQVVQLSAGSAALLTNPVKFASSGNFVTLNGYGLNDGDPIQFADTLASGTMPAGVLPFKKYYLKGVNQNVFQIALTKGGAAVTFTGDDVAHAGVFMWPVIPGLVGTLAGALQPYLEYFVVNAVANVSFQLSLTSGGSAITLTDDGAVTSRVAPVWAGIFLEGASGNIVFDARIWGCLIDGGSASWTDGSARHGIRASSAIHSIVVGGEIADVKTGVSSLASSETYVTDLHVYNCFDASGGSAAFRSDAPNGLTARQTRNEVPGLERVAVFASNSFTSSIEGSPSCQAWQIVELGSGDSWRLGTNAGVQNVQAGSWAFGPTTCSGSTGFPAIQEQDAATGAVGRMTETANGTTVSNATFNARPTDVFQSQADLAVEMLVTMVARRTGGSRVTGAINDSAKFVREALITSNAGTLTIVAGAVVGSDILSSDLNTAGLAAPTFSAGPTYINIACLGVLNVNLEWTVYTEWKAVSK